VPIDSLRPLAFARAGIGALTLLRTTPLLLPLQLWFVRDTVPLLGWPQGHSLTSPLALPGAVIAGLCVVRTVGAVLLMVGVWTRYAGIATGLCGYAVMVQDPLGSVFTLHLLYQAALLLGISDSSSEFALRPVPVRSPRSSVLLVRLWVASIYLWAGISKLRRDWLDGRTLELLRAEGRLGGRLVNALLAHGEWRIAGAVAVVVTELTLGPALLWRRTRRAALGAAFGFHALLEVTARPDLLGWGMMVLLLVFLDPAPDGQGWSATQRMAAAG
jgi:vitamin K-dependent gamma-carboxylase